MAGAGRDLVTQAIETSSLKSPSTLPSQRVSNVPGPALQNSAMLERGDRLRALRSKWSCIWQRGKVTYSDTGHQLYGEKADLPTGAEPLDHNEEDVPDDMSVDQVVVDRSWHDDFKETLSEAPASYERTDEPSVQSTSFLKPSSSSSALCKPIFTFFPRLWTFQERFVSSEFADAQTEADYQEEVWTHSKRLALLSSIFFVINWLLGVAFIGDPIVLADKVFYYVVAPAFTIPIVFFCAFDFPHDHSIFYQVFLSISVWSWPFYQLIYIVLCTDSTGGRFTCGNKDFLSTFYYTSALQTIALFGAALKRVPSLIGASAFLTCFSSLILPVRRTWTRNILDFVVYEAVLLYIHYRRENSSRRLFSLRMQLNIQFEQTRQAQINERNAADSKRRLTSYVFHEVRVPLNTALLAVQNMEATNAIDTTQVIEFSALEGSLSMMSKVLNDVLDFNRMDSGRLESVSQPYAFHQVMRSMFIPLKLASNARSLEFVTDLDLEIDEVARRAYYRALGESDQEIEQHLRDEPCGDESNWGLVVGDETRLRQIVTNLASNACKFTPAGGKLKVTTHLVLPMSPKEDTWPLDRVVVRIEVTDTGWGIRPKDMEGSKLFSAFNQTEQGRLQGGKGTGLGLALVRQIVNLSGGRLGVKSKVGRGSTFWVELPLGVGEKAVSSGCPIPRNACPGAILDHMADIPGTPLSPTTIAAAMQSPQGSLSTRSRSSSALHGLMDQGGSVELVLTRYDNSHTAVPTRSLGDPYTGTDYPTLAEIDLGSDDEAHEAPLQRCSSEYKSQSIRRPTLKHSVSAQSCEYLRTYSHDTASLFGCKVHVLVVDDDPLTRMLMKRMLTRMGCKVSTAENGEVAVSMILGHPYRSLSEGSANARLRRLSAGTNNASRFTVVFMDNQMPVMSGLKAIKRLRSLGRSDFVVGVTGNALLADQKEYLEAGVDHVLTKPVLEQSLKEMMLKALSRIQSWQ